jgi:receptor expression-enhancing protein 5/6
VVFGLFNVIDQFAGFVLHFIPFYYVLKLAVLIWLFHPKSVGATWVYNNYIKEYAGHINEIEKSVEGTIKQGINSAKNVVGFKSD